MNKHIDKKIVIYFPYYIFTRLLNFISFSFLFHQNEKRINKMIEKKKKFIIIVETFSKFNANTEEVSR